MKTRNLSSFLLAGTVLLTIQGCMPIQLPPIPLDLSGAEGTFEVLAGVPARNTARFSGVELPIELGGGSIGVSLDNITVTPGGVIGKHIVSAQDVNTCEAACTAAGVDAATCTNVCDNNVLLLRIYVGPFDDIDADCENGDLYNVSITLDENGNPTGLTVDPNQFAQDTQDLFNSGGEIGLCIEAISPIDATITLAQVTLNFTL